MNMLESLNRLKPKNERQRQLPLSGLSQVLLMDWTESHASVALLVRDQETWRIDKEVEILWTDENGKAYSLDLRSKRLSEALTKNGLACRNVVVSVPRRNAVIKLLDLPSVAPDVLTDAVILQAESRGISAEAYVIDYLEQPETTDGFAFVLMAAYPRQSIEDVQTTIRGAGLTVMSIGIGEIGLAGALPRHDRPDPGLLMIAETDSIDFVVTRFGCPISLMTLPLTVNTENYGKVITATLSRLFLALPQGLVAEGLHTIAATGPEANSAITAMQSKYALQIHKLETPPTQSLRAWGLAMDQRQPNFRIDFCNPKQRLDVPALNRAQRNLWLLRGGLVLALVFVCFRFYLSQLESRVGELSSELLTLENRSLAQEEILETADQLAQWQTSKVNWSQELVRFLGPMPDNQRVFLNRLRVEQSQNQVPDIRIEGLARDLDDAIEMNQKLVGQSPRYQIRPDSIDRQNTNPHYRVGFVVSAMIDTESHLDDEVTAVSLTHDEDLTLLSAEKETP